MRLGILSLLLVSNLFAGELSTYIQQNLNYGKKPPVSQTQQNLNKLFCSEGKDCSYSGVDYKHFDKEGEARNKYLEKANNPKDPLGMGLSTMWKLSEIKSTKAYKEAEKQYQCVKFSPDGKCEMYQAESYYGECKTVKECVSWNTQQFYAKYTCSIDTLSQQKSGETENLCFKYNVIEPQLKEKYHTCFVVQNEHKEYCYKQLNLKFGSCELVTGKVLLHTEKIGPEYYPVYGGVDLSYLPSPPGCVAYSLFQIPFWECYNNVQLNLTNVVKLEFHLIFYNNNCALSIAPVPFYPQTITPICTSDIYYAVGWGIIPCNRGIQPYQEYIYTTSVSEDSITISIDTLSSYSGHYCSGEVKIYGYKKVYKCNLNGQIYSDKTACYAHCYTEEIQDCSR